jgi:ectoine hydroxylase-related dioxygenase (phytanoyl-CoA dioxygenase family)
MEAETVVDGVPLQVEEMTGEPGDLYLMHPAALHAAAPNVLSEPRLVLAQFVMPKP